ncbi:MAG: hypothetical protein WKG07_14775 [Hymenobacter sp.]
MQAQALFNYNNRIEFSTLQTQQALAGLDLRNRRAGAYPSPAASRRPTASRWLGAHGEGLSGLPRAQTRATSAGFVNQNWFGFGNVGLSPARCRCSMASGASTRCSRPALQQQTHGARLRDAAPKH